MKTITKALFLATLFLAFSIQAEVKLKDNSEILGVWSLYAEAMAIDKEKRSINTVWEFKKDGTLNTKSKDTRGRTGTIKIPLKYSIVDGAIRKQSTPGREKYETCKVVEKEGYEMVLKCKFLHYFLRKGGKI
jgi:hypothetical protein